MSNLSGGDYVFLSPHPDDVALSFGSALGQPDRDVTFTLITVFSKTDFIGPDQPRDAELSSKIRESEDVTFADSFGLDRIDLGFSDFPLRTGLPVDQCRSAPTDAGQLVLDALLRLTWVGDTTIIAPSGVGNHVDHLACRDASMEFGRLSGLPVLFYSDMPYAIRNGTPRDPTRVFVAGDGESWFRAVQCYPSQVRLVRECVQLAGDDGAPMLGAYLSTQATGSPSSIVQKAPPGTLVLAKRPRSSSGGVGRPSDGKRTTGVAPPFHTGAEKQTEGELVRYLAVLEQQIALLNQRSQGMQERLEQLAAESALRQSTLEELRDSVDYTARATTLKRQRTRVLFLVHLIEAWDSYHELVRAMAGSDDFEPVVASIPRHFNGDTALGFEDEVHLGLERAGIAHLRLRPHDMDQALRLIKSIEPDLIFRQSQWDADIADELRTEHLGFARTCLVPYETMNIVENVPSDLTRNSAVDSSYHRGAWVVFCTNDFVLDTARRDGVRLGAQFRVVGHPKADQLRATSPVWPVANADRAGQQRRIAWSAHHTIGRGWTDFGAFPLMADDMLAWARHRSDTEFVFLPHPALLPYTRSPDCPISAAQFDSWLSAWNALPNTGFSADGDYGPVLAASDLLITDGLSLLIEYQLLERPLVFFERDGHRPFNEIGELVRRGAHTVTTVNEARHVVDELLGGIADPLQLCQRDIVERLFGTSPSAPRILSTLREMIASERGGTGGGLASELTQPLLDVADGRTAVLHTIR
jgi:LmbE family N-acetylglucosaminyl deacetylase